MHQQADIVVFIGVSKIYFRYFAIESSYCARATELIM